MTKEERNKRLENLARSEYSKALLEFLQEKINIMSDINTVKNWEELVGKQEAVKILKEIFRFLETKKEGKELKTKSQYL